MTVPCLLRQCATSFPRLPVDDLLDTFVRNYVATYDRERFSLHPLDQQYAYRQIPDADGDYAKPALHARAAEYFRRLRKPHEAWKTIDDLEPQLQEFPISCAPDFLTVPAPC